MTIDEYALSDRYTKEQTTSFLSGVQALARLPLEQLMADRRDGTTRQHSLADIPVLPSAGMAMKSIEQRRLHMISRFATFQPSTKSMPLPP